MLLYGHDDKSIPASEYLATNALFACKKDGERDFMWHDYKMLEMFAKNAFVPNVEKLAGKVDDLNRLAVYAIGKE